MLFNLLESSEVYIKTNYGKFLDSSKKKHAYGLPSMSYVHQHLWQLEEARSASPLGIQQIY